MSLTFGRAWRTGQAEVAIGCAGMTVIDDWRGRTGLVHQALMADWPDLSGHQVYACGTPAMVDAAQRDLVNLSGLPADEFIADAFTSEADKHR